MGMESQNQRRLAALMFIDMVGFTALTRAQEPQALAMLAELQDLVENEADKNTGQQIKALGDGFLYTFPSTLGAVNSALAIQEQLRTRNAQPGAVALDVRIGIHLGDVEHRGGDVFGYDVNLAQRVQSVSIPGEIWFTQPVYDQVRSRLGDRIRPVGQRALKSLPEPIRLYRVPCPEGAEPGSRGRTRPRLATLAAGLCVAGLLVGLLWWMHNTFGAGARLQVVVLPFTSIPDTPDTRDFCGGLEQTLCSALTLVGGAQPAIRVIPFNEVHRSGIAVPSAAMRAFGANRVLTGSVQRQGDQLRVTLNLIDGTGQIKSHILDKLQGDVYTLQDDLASRAASMLGFSPTQLNGSGASSQTHVAAAFEACLRGLGKLARFDKAENLDGAVADFRTAIEEDSHFALAYAGLAETYWRKYEFTKVASWKDRAVEAAGLAEKFGPDLSRTRVVLGLIAEGTGQQQRAEAEYQRAVALDPGNPEVYVGLARLLNAQGKVAAAERNFQIAIERLPDYWAGYNRLAGFYLEHNRYAEAETNYRRALEKTPDNYEVYANLGGLYYYMGREQEALTALRRSLSLRPTADAYSNLGTLQFLRGSYTDATRTFQDAVGLDTNNAVLWGNLADAQRLAKVGAPVVAAVYRKAVDLARQELEINPKQSLLRACLATYLANLWEREAALQEIARARADDPDNSQVAFLSALVHEAAGQRAQALAEIKIAVQKGYSPREIRVHPDLALLRQSPQFAEIAERLNAAAKTQ